MNASSKGLVCDLCGAVRMDRRHALALGFRRGLRLDSETLIHVRFARRNVQLMIES